MRSEDIRIWLATRLAEEVEITTSEIDPAIPFERYGVDSMAAVSIAGDLESWLQCELDAALLIRYPTIEVLADFLAKASDSSTVPAPVVES